MAESPFIELEVVTEFAIIGAAATGDDLQLAFRRCGSRREIVLHVDQIVVGPWNAIQVLDHGTRRGEVGAPVTLVANPLDVGKIAPGPQAIGQLNEACLPFPAHNNVAEFVLESRIGAERWMNASPHDRDRGLD